MGTHVTALICVAPSIVRGCVAVTLDCTCEVAVTTTVLVGTVAGALYNPLCLSIVPGSPLPPLCRATLQFTRVLLRFRTVAVHCEVFNTVTSRGVQDTVIVGVAVLEETEPQDVTRASAAANPKNKSPCFQCNVARSLRSFRSNTRNPPHPRPGELCTRA